MTFKSVHQDLSKMLRFLWPIAAAFILFYLASFVGRVVLGGSAWSPLIIFVIIAWPTGFCIGLFGGEETRRISKLDRWTIVIAVCLWSVVSALRLFDPGTSSEFAGLVFVAFFGGLVVASGIAAASFLILLKRGNATSLLLRERSAKVRVYKKIIIFTVIVIALLAPQPYLLFVRAEIESPQESYDVGDSLILLVKVTNLRLLPYKFNIDCGEECEVATVYKKKYAGKNNERGLTSTAIKSQVNLRPFASITFKKTIKLTLPAHTAFQDYSVDSIQAGPGLNTMYIKWFDPLYPKKDTVQFMVNENSSHWGKLVEMVEDDQFDKIDQMIAGGADVNEPDEYGRTPLGSAVYFSDFKMVSFLIERGAVAEGKDLMTLALYGLGKDELEIAKLLIGAGANVNFREPAEHNRTPLLTAIYKGKVELSKILIENGADAWAVSDIGEGICSLATYDTLLALRDILSKEGLSCPRLETPSDD